MRSQLESDELAALARAFALELPGIDVEDFRRAGYLPEVVCNYLALLGWSPGLKDAEGRDVERFDAVFLAEHFAPERVGRSNARFDREKLLAFNQERILELDDAVFLERWREWCARYEPQALQRFGEDGQRRLVAALRPRARTLADLRGCSLEEMAACTSATARRLFGWADAA